MVTIITDMGGIMEVMADTGNIMAEVTGDTVSGKKKFTLEACFAKFCSTHYLLRCFSLKFLI